MITIVKGTETIGALVRARRKAAGLTQAQAAGLAGVGNRFLSELERGKKTVEFDRVLQVLERLGFELAVAPRGARLFVSQTEAARTRSTFVEPQPPKKVRKQAKRKRGQRG